MYNPVMQASRAIEELQVRNIKPCDCRHHPTHHYWPSVDEPHNRNWGCMVAFCPCRYTGNEVVSMAVELYREILKNQ